MFNRGAELSEICRQIRLDTIDLCYQAGVGHIGSALSIIEVLAVLYFRILNVNSRKPQNKKRDRFILSKGHGAAAYYATLYRAGFLKKSGFESFCVDGGKSGTHPKRDINRGIEFSTGSLGMGLSVGTGMALASKTRVYVLISDAELNEGSTWEAIMFAGHHRLANLTVIVDANNSQAFGKCREVINLHPLEGKFKAFGWSVNTVDGHNANALLKSLSQAQKFQPKIIIAKTIIGKGISFFENKIASHYLPLNKESRKKAFFEIKNS